MEKNDNDNKIGFNLACEHFKQNLVDMINNSNLPISSVYYIMSNLYQEVETTYYRILNTEAKENPIELGNDNDDSIEES